MSGEPAQTSIRVRGNATAEDLAAVVAVLSAVGSDAAPPASPMRVWGSPARQVGATRQPSPGGWSRSALPH